MVFSSTFFLFAFLPAVLAIYALISLSPWKKGKNYFLLLASLVFYAWGEPVYVLLMLGSICVNYFLGLAMDVLEGGRKKAVLVLACLANLGALFFFKYIDFTITNLNALLGLSMPLKRISLPIGISFFSFQALSYVIDVYRGSTKVQRNPLYLGLYIAFFPQLIAGPIVRYNSIEEQIENRSVSLTGFQSGVERFIQGFAKKVLLANELSVVAEYAFNAADGGSISCAMAWLGALAYTFQIFFDFSGYSDMAIGLGRMFGFEFEENFNFPYISRSVSEFWNRWHISLGHWFRDYLYFPLGGSRVDRPRLVRNLFVVWLATGVWHGAAWQYIVWGLMYGLIITFEKLSGIPRKLSSKPARGLYAGFTLLMVVLGWVLFGARSLNSALFQISAMFCAGTFTGADEMFLFYLGEYKYFFLLAALFSTPIVGILCRKLAAGREDSFPVHILRAAVYTFLLLVSVSYLAIGAHNPFIYFTF